ncbi:MAG: tRNA (N6-isopentenyl adenosine(37)-C2)-methylthiotransferase MiaB [Bacteroidales bacterium]|nr:tRNA (N6-isopentenyl adenosine(37)-C2)-methylthiotransferase MiaB [Candidatus Latescibacterota bacterium]
MDERLKVLDMMKTYYESFGCQMNAFDTEVIESMMIASGFETVQTAGEADVIVVNTCSVRENAEQRAIGRLNDLSRNRAVLVVCGCMAQRMGDSLFKKVSGLSLIVGPDNYLGLVSAVISIIEGGEKNVITEQDENAAYRLGSTSDEKDKRVSRFLSITRGCENFCSYCIVPYLRGPVRSRDIAHILHEVDILTAAGAEEITLLGQNVMAYNRDGIDFTGLIRHILENSDIRRLRFLTTHPRDVDKKIFQIMNEDQRLCPHIHLPFQAGSDRVLSLMGRGYTRQHYLDIVSEARKIRPDLAITTDIIVGFPSETDADFEETLGVVRDCRFDSAFTFKYSPREGTSAYKMDDDVSSELKKERLARLNSLVQKIRKEILESRVGLTDEILLDARVKKGEYLFWKGRTPHFRNVLVSRADLNNGDVLQVYLTGIRNFTYIGEVV